MADQMTVEQLIATFGQEVGEQMFAQMNASAGGSGAPFPFLKAVSKHTSPLGAFGDFVYGNKQEKSPDGTYEVTDNGTNLGRDFEFIIVNVAYRLKRYVEAEEKTYRSNIFATLDGVKSAVDLYSGKPIPADKETRKAMDWKLVKIHGGLVRKNSKAKWESVILEVHGSLYFTLGEVVNNQPGNGLLSGTLKLVMEQREKGSTLFTVIDATKSKFGPLPKDLFTNEASKEMLGDITKKMTEYRVGAQYSGVAVPAAGQAPEGQAPAGAEDDAEW